MFKPHRIFNENIKTGTWKYQEEIMYTNKNLEMAFDMLYSQIINFELSNGKC